MTRDLPNLNILKKTVRQSEFGPPRSTGMSLRASQNLRHNSAEISPAAGAETQTSGARKLTDGDNAWTTGGTSRDRWRGGFNGHLFGALGLRQSDLLE